METFDFTKTLKPLYAAKKQVEAVDAKAGIFFAVEAQGAPGGDVFQQAIQCLYGTAYTVKFTLKRAGILDFKVCPLECLYFSDPDETPMSEWQWRLMLRVPDAVTTQHLAEAKKTFKERKGLDASAVKRVRWTEGRAVQMLHVGPYDQMRASYNQLDAYAREHGLCAQCPAHEVYLSDPRRAAPERLKTIVRLSVKKAGSPSA